IWLIEGPNLQVSIDIDGNVSGTTSYTSMVVGIDENLNKRAEQLFRVRGKNISLVTDQDGKLTLSSVDGKSVMICLLKPGHHHYSLNHLRSGTYIFSFQTSENRQYQKLIINH
ncbi:MAG TPA: T9SS type A sorting domain-containing protein, partial [Bacteroidales bacterium]|nr:T9SS type A sorting domain-containing protein [Bacteroidales bacterium]